MIYITNNTYSRISIKLSEQELKILNEKIDKAGISKSDYIRSAVLNSNIKTSSTIRISDMRKLVISLKSLNNYITKIYNINKNQDILDLLALSEKELFNIWQLLK